MNQQARIQHEVNLALSEDLNGLAPQQGDITASLIDEKQAVSGEVITRENCILCGQQWVEEAFKQVDSTLAIIWHKHDGDHCKANDVLFKVTGTARAILTAERTALNFLQTLSGTATTTYHYVKLLEGSGITLLDTRKTLPGLRHAQKYAVKCGGGQNHRMGLFDAFLIKENHILAAGSIAAAVSSARRVNSDVNVEVEVESLDELLSAIKAGADIVMLDNFTLEMLKKAVEINQHRVKLEVSGNITQEKLADLVHTGIDFVSSGALTKDLKSIDLSLRIK